MTACLQPSLQIENLHCDKGQQRLFSGVDCLLNAGELLHVSGENGSGKTTLLRILAGLSRDYTGSVLWNGDNIRQQWPVYAQDILFLGHQPALKAQLTARENLQWYARCADVTDEQIDSALQALGLRSKTDIPCHQLSAGQQRRTALARLMFSRHKLWLLDEPFTAIDAKGFAPILQCLRLQIERGGIVVMTTHHGMENMDLPHKTLTLGAAA
ncbi:MAG TPA: cytochrome c biogenesis heme-transporting ATPase CcmA [Pseudomonadales bacterium]|nr:cytochrome c biogenesis heme-transporting ATPase CcmA [Pseudomonadales bacterium]